MNEASLLHSTLLNLKKHNNFVFLWNGKADRENYRSFLFLDPHDIISTCRHDEVKDCFFRIEDKLSKGYYLAGYISYEAASAFEDTLPKTNTQDLPLLWFGAYKKMRSLWRHPLAKISLNSYSISNLKTTKTQKSYLADISKIKDYIRKGDTYQVNYTFKYKFKFKGCPFSLFYDLNKKQYTPYAAFIGFDNKKILSLSPELFFRRNANILTVKPMKGTIERGRDIFQDRIKEIQLKNSLKDRAENVMIVDMLRNDLGKISKPGSVKTTRLFETERYQTLHQMTSTIKSALKPRTTWFDIFKSIFPSGSVTGAPKIKTMQIINELEKLPRNIYTGCIGYISPKNDAVFNVAIRTILLDESKKEGELGIGSGITVSSNPKREFEECELKANFFTKKEQDFKLIETMLWQNGRFFLLGLHLKRLRDSAGYFYYKYSKDYILKSLKRHSSSFDKNKKYRIRLLLNENGEAEVTSSILENGVSPYITFSRRQIDNSNLFLYHKTTNRKFYDDEYLRYKRKGFTDVIFFNKKGEITEGAISNIIVKNKKYYYTPPVSSGLLNGVFRQYLLNKQIFPLKEKILHKQDILKAEKIFVCNSVRCLQEVKFML